MNSLELRLKYKKFNPQGYFFDAETMRFWRSKVEHILTERHDGCVFFMTSEDSWEKEPVSRFTLRVLIPKENGGIKTLAAQAFEREFREEAIEALKEYKKTFILEK